MSEAELLTRIDEALVRLSRAYAASDRHPERAALEIAEVGPALFALTCSLEKRTLRGMTLHELVEIGAAAHPEIVNEADRVKYQIERIEWARTAIRI